MQGLKLLQNRFWNAKNNKSAPPEVLKRYNDNKSNKAAIRRMLLDWMQDKSWVHMRQVIAWEKQICKPKSRS